MVRMNDAFGSVFDILPFMSSNIHIHETWILSRSFVCLFVFFFNEICVIFDHNRLNFQIFSLLVPEKSSLKLAEVLRIDYRNKRAILVLSFEYPVFIS